MAIWAAALLRTVLLPIMIHSIYGQLAAAQASDPIVAALASSAAVTNGTNTSTTASSDIIGTGSRDTTFTKIFVGGLPYHTTDKTLHEYFEQFGDIEEAVVITDRQTQKSRGYGFVTMKDRAAAERACKDPNPIIDGRKANVNLAYLGAKPRGNVQLAALSNIGQLPLQAQLQALFPGRIGLPQLYYPTQLVNPLAGLQPAALAAVAQSAAASQGSAAALAAAASAQPQQQYLDYLAAAAAAGTPAANAAIALHPAADFLFVAL
ncbi:hypothetical protein L596_014432 [Steinernema carpocapsae]|uniref:RRM domain-containing protein n=1 Tax=Steinernema carpocapsae TaxID=34508 RepID=A0A4U5NBX3_STECR|nr:hypothetical protein L596_014432 [Steinernema carpocapsae]